MPSPEEMSSACKYWSTAFHPRLSLLDDTQSYQMAREEFDTVAIFFDSLKARVNAFTSIARLPDEVLARIFEVLRDSWRPELGRSLGWIRAATHTFRRWRNILLAHPSLWAEINSDVSSKWVTEMLSRAKAVPLAIQLARERKGPLTTGPLIERLGQIKRLSLAGASYVSADLKALIHPAPLLEEFTVHVNGIAALPSMLFAGCVPRLRVLNLFNCCFSWATLPTTSALTCLRVSSSHDFGRMSHSMLSTADQEELLGSYRSTGYDQLFGLLENNRHTLQTLVLTECLPTRPSDGAHDYVVELPRLALLELGGSPARCEDFLQRVAIPPSAALVLSVSPNADSPESADLEGVLRQVAMHSHAGPPMRRLGIRAELHRSWSSSSLITIGFSGYRDGVPVTTVKLVWSPRESEEPVPGLLWDALHLSDVEELSASLTYGFPWSVRLWQHLFGDFKGVTSLSIRGRAVAALRHVDGERAAQPGAAPATVDPRLLKGPTRDAFFPKLVSLDISSPDIDSDEEGHSFLRWLRFLRASGLESLKIDDCAFSSKHAHVIREIIPNAIVAPEENDVGIPPFQPIVQWPGYFQS